MTRTLAARLAEVSTLLAIVGAAGVVITHTTKPDVARITGRIVPVVETVRPEPLGQWQVAVAVEACFSMVATACQGIVSNRDYWACVDSYSDRCTVGNTQRVGGW